MAVTDYTEGEPLVDISPRRITANGDNPVGAIGRPEQSYLKFCDRLNEQTEIMIHGKTLFDKVNFRSR